MISAKTFCDLLAKQDYATLSAAYARGELTPKWSWVTRINPGVSLEEEFIKISGLTRPLCITCKTNPVSSFISFSSGYNNYCSKSCAKKDPQVEQKKQHSLQQKPGWQASAHKKSVETNLQKYGTKSAMQNSDVLSKRKNTNLLRYGSDEVLGAVSSIRQQVTSDIAANKVFSRIGGFQHIIPNFTRQEYKNADAEYSWTCISCNSIFSSSLADGSTPRCTRCNPRTSSAGEHALRIFVEGLVAEEVIQRYKLDKTEIDIFVPSKYLGIEFNGIYWHSELRGTSKTYHIDKKNKCFANGITLLQFWDYQWETKREIVKSIIANALGKTSNRIYARQCVIRELDEDTSSKFLDSNHLSDNARGSKLRVGLYYKDMLVAVSTFCSPRFSRKDRESIELLRFANTLSTTVTGGAGRLIKYAIQKLNPSKIISFCDEMVFTGTVYKSLGFDKIDIGKPSAWYFSSNGILKHRTAYQKKKLLTMIGIQSSEKTEWELAQQLKLNRVWDCGSSKWELDVVSN